MIKRGKSAKSKKSKEIKIHPTIKEKSQIKKSRKRIVIFYLGYKTN